MLGLPQRGGFWKRVQVTLPCRNSCTRLCIHLTFTYSVGPSSICVKRTWTGSTFSTNESAWSVTVTGSQSCVWSGPKLAAPNAHRTKTMAPNKRNRLARRPLCAIFTLCPNLSCRIGPSNDRGEPAVSYKWTGWSSRLQENYRSF